MSDQIDMLPEILDVEALKLHRGDILIVKLDEYVSKAQVTHIRDQLRAQLDKFGHENVMTLVYPANKVEITKLSMDRMDALEKRLVELEDHVKLDGLASIFDYKG